jgi:protein tyrosine phosphatase
MDGEELSNVVAKTVASLRQQRHPWMVEGNAQYIFAHAVLLQGCAATAGATVPTLRLQSL